MTRMRIAAVVAAACLLLGGLTVANAAQLSVDGGSLSTASATTCAAAIASDATDPQFDWIWFVGYRSVTLTGVPTECAGRPVQVIVYRTSNGVELTRSAVLTLSAGTFVIPVNQAFGGWFTPAWGLRMIVDGWVVTAS